MEHVKPLPSVWGVLGYHKIHSREDVMTKMTERNILDELNANLATTVVEILGFAREEEEQKEAQSFLNVAEHDMGAVEEYVFELLKAYGCCAYGVATDDENSRQLIKRLENQHPSLRWAKDMYQQAIDLDDINADLHNDPQNMVVAQDRLVAWLS